VSSSPITRGKSISQLIRFTHFTKMKSPNVRTPSAVRTPSSARTPSGPFKCKTCGKGYKTQLNLNRHTKMCQERPYACSSCNRHFPDLRSLTAHESTHSKRKLFSCHTCNVSFATRSQLNGHETEEHTVLETSNFQPKKLFTLKIKNGAEPEMTCQFTPPESSSSNSATEFPEFVTSLPDSEPLKQVLKDELRSVFDDERSSSSDETVWEARDMVMDEPCGLQQEEQHHRRQEHLFHPITHWQLTGGERLPQQCRPLKYQETEPSFH